MTKLILADGTQLVGQPFGAAVDAVGELVCNTGMVGYPETLTDPSYAGQMLTFTYPLIGNIGVPSTEVNHWNFSKYLESEQIHPVAVVAAQVAAKGSHFSAVHSFNDWLAHAGVPGISGIDTRLLAKKIFTHGVLPARLVQDDTDLALPTSVPATFYVPMVSCTEVLTYEPTEGLSSSGEPIATIVIVDCGVKNAILRQLLKRGVRVLRVPYNYRLAESDLQFSGVIISNGPGDPALCTQTIAQITWAVTQNIPVFGIGLGHQLLAKAIGMQTYKLLSGHRGSNLPCREYEPSGTATNRCIITAQNNGFIVKDSPVPSDWYIWWRDANDNAITGMAHRTKPQYSVQFNPEGNPGPEDAMYLFDLFITDAQQSTR